MINDKIKLLYGTWPLKLLTLYFKVIKWTRLPSVIRVACVWEEKNYLRILDINLLDKECFLVVMPHSGPTDHLIPCLPAAVFLEPEPDNPPPSSMDMYYV